MFSDFTPPDSHHVVMFGAGTIIHVDSEVRREIEVWLKSSDERTLDITTILGEDVTLVRDKVNGIWSCTPATRAADRALDALYKAERAPE
jgi:hypothetical protein